MPYTVKITKHQAPDEKGYAKDQDIYEQRIEDDESFSPIAVIKAVNKLTPTDPKPQP